MSQEIPSVLLEHYLVRAIMSLSVAAAKTELDDLRDDLRDSATLLVRLAITVSADVAIRDWCDRTLALLETMEKFDEQPISSARLAVLRLRSVLPTMTEKEQRAITDEPKAKIISPRPSSLGNNPKKIIEFVKDNPDVRTRELVANFLPTMSERTIKRCLKELVDCGALERSRHEGAVLYRVQSDK